MAKKKTKKDKKKPTRKSNEYFIAKAPMRRLMRTQGAEIVGKDALGLLIKEVEKAGQDITKIALGVVKDQDRKKITAEDVRFAFYESGYGDWDDAKKKEKDENKK